MPNPETIDTPLNITTGDVLVSRCEDWGWVGICRLVKAAGPKVAVVHAGRPIHWSYSGTRMRRVDITAARWIRVTEEQAEKFLETLQALYVKHGKPSASSFQDKDGYRFYHREAVEALRALAA